MHFITAEFSRCYGAAIPSDLQTIIKRLERRDLTYTYTFDVSAQCTLTFTHKRIEKLSFHSLNFLFGGPIFYYFMPWHTTDQHTNLQQHSNSQRALFHTLLLYSSSTFRIKTFASLILMRVLLLFTMETARKWGRVEEKEAKAYMSLCGALEALEPVHKW